MKKFVAVLVLLLVCVAAAQAEEPFVFDGKITWNSTFSDIVAAYGDYEWIDDVGFADANGNIITADGSKGMLKVVDQLSGWSAADKEIPKESIGARLQYGNFCVAGVPNCTLSFIWSEANGLIISTETQRNLPPEEIKTAYGRICKALIAKYGEPNEKREDDRLIYWYWDNVGDNTVMTCQLHRSYSSYVNVTYADKSKRNDSFEIPPYTPNMNGI